MVICVSAVSYRASKILAPVFTGSQMAGAPGVSWPSEVLVQLSAGSTTGKRLPRTSIRVVLMYTRSSAVMDVADAFNSKRSIAP